MFCGLNVREDQILISTLLISVLLLLDPIPLFVGPIGPIVFWAAPNS